MTHTTEEDFKHFLSYSGFSNEPIEIKNKMKLAFVAALKDEKETQNTGKYEVVREKLAAYAHEAWSGWMKYMFLKSNPRNTDGSVTIPALLVERWDRQMNTEYRDLPENEKQSDRDEANRMLKIVQGEVASNTEIR